MKKCPYCAEEIQDEAIICRYCGHRQPVQTPPPFQQAYGPAYTYSDNPFDPSGPEGKSRGVCALLAIFLGWLGVHYFYLGKTGAGILTFIFFICSCTLWAYLMVIQGILMFFMSNDYFEQKYVRNPSFMPMF